MAAELFGPADIPKIVGLTDLRSHNLTAEEGFLLSRIDGRTNVGGLLALVSWDRAKTFDLLESLLRKHVVNFDRPEILNQVNARAGQTSSAVASNGPAGPVAATTAALPAIDRSSMEKVADIEEARCVEILEWEQRVKMAASLYALFGIPDGADVRSVKREYRQLAMKFHPDKFFRKEIGGYRPRIDGCWKVIQEAYERLTESESKAVYDADILSRPAAPRPAAPVPEGTTGPGKGWMAPPPPPSSAGVSGRPASASASPAPLPVVPTPEPRTKFESAFERKIRQEVREAVEKSLRSFEQAQLDFKEKKFVACDASIKLALQLDPKNEDYQKWYNQVKPVLEESIVAGILRRGELAGLSHDSKAAQEAYEHAFQLFPENLLANRALGLIMLERNEPNVKRIRECLQRVATAKPKDLDVVVGLAKALRLMGMAKNAQRVLEQARELSPKDLRVIEEAKELKKL